MTSKLATTAFSVGVSIVDGAHAAATFTAKAAKVTAAQSKAVVSTSKEVGTSFWAGMKFAHQRNKDRAIPKLGK